MKTKLEKTNDIGFWEFAQRVFAIARGSLKNPEKEGGWRTYWVPVKDVDDIDRKTELFGSEVHTGGVSGGSCWDEGESHHHAYTAEHEDPTIECLDDILADFCPQITFLQYKRLAKEAEIKSEERSENEYYGNSTNYVFKHVNLYTLYLAMVTIGVIGETE